MSIFPNPEAEFFFIVTENRRASRSQLFQDLYVLWKLQGKSSGFFCEFGATDGVEKSNTFLLESMGWTGVLAEPFPLWHDALHKNRKCLIAHRAVWSRTGEQLEFNAVDSDPELATIAQFSACDNHSSKRAQGRSIVVETVSLNDLLQSANAPADFDYLSVDTEGSELEVLAALDWNRYRPRIITVEHNYMPLREQIRTLLEGIGYRRELVTLSLWDDWYAWPGLPQE